MSGKCGLVGKTLTAQKSGRGIAGSLGAARLLPSPDVAGRPADARRRRRPWACARAAERGAVLRLRCARPGLVAVAAAGAPAAGVAADARAVRAAAVAPFALVRVFARVFARVLVRFLA